MAGCSWTKTLTITALMMIAGAAQVGFAQSTGGSLSGRLTNLYSKPLSGAAVVVRNEVTGAEARSTTTRSGDYRFKGLGSGSYTLEVEDPRLGRGYVDGIVVADGHDSRVQAAFKFEPLQSDSLTDSHVGTVDPKLMGILARASTPPKKPVLAELLPVADYSTLQTNAPPVNEAVGSESLESLPLTTRTIQNTLPQRPSPVPSMPTDIAPIEPSNTEPLVAAIRVERNSIGAATGGIDSNVAVVSMPVGLAHAAFGVPGAAMAEIAANAAWATLQFEPVPRTTLASDEGLDPGTTASSQTVTAEQLQALPVTDRNWQNFVLDAPSGGAQPEGEGRAPQGGNQRSAITVDGAGMRLAFGGSGVGRMSGRSAALIGPGASEAAIREVQTLDGNVDASAGPCRLGGAQTLKPGAVPPGCTAKALFSTARIFGARKTPSRSG